MGKMKVTLVRSTIGKPKDQKGTVFALGLRKMHQTVELEETPQIMGMVKKVSHLLSIEKA
ncbi:MAG: 50S ribosomal protein L30 [Bacteroidota bacterium]